MSLLLPVPMCVHVALLPSAEAVGAAWLGLGLLANREAFAARCGTRDTGSLAQDDPVRLKRCLLGGLNKTLGLSLMSLC